MVNMFQIAGIMLKCLYIQIVRKGINVKVKELSLSIVLNLFLGYLFVLFVDHIVHSVNSINNYRFIIGVPIILVGTALFFEIVKRVTPFNKYKLPHPVKIAGIASFGVVVFVHLFVLSLV